MASEPQAEAVPPLPVSHAGRNLVGALVLGAGAWAGWHWFGQSLPTPHAHRATSVKCGASMKVRGRDAALDGCKSDAECSSGSNGRCERTMVSHAHFENRCRYDGCAVDQDCRGKGEPGSDRGPCLCGEQGDVNACLPGNCSTDADCGLRGYCSPSRDFQCGNEGTPGYYCHTRDDACTSDRACPPGPGGARAECRYDPNAERWACSSAECRRY